LIFLKLNFVLLFKQLKLELLNGELFGDLCNEVFLISDSVFENSIFLFFVFDEVFHSSPFLLLQVKNQFVILDFLLLKSQGFLKVFIDVGILLLGNQRIEKVNRLLSGFLYFLIFPSVLILLFQNLKNTWENRSLLQLKLPLNFFTIQKLAGKLFSLLCNHR